VLIGGSEVILKGFGDKDAVVAVDVLDGYVVPFCKRFESDLELQGGLCCSVFQTMGVQEVGKMVYPHGYCGVTALGRAAVCERDETWTASDHLIDGEKIACLLGDYHSVNLCLTFPFCSLLLCCTVLTSATHWDLTMCDVQGHVM
jgi:hypothetical protein